MKEPAVLFQETLVSLLEEKKYSTLRDVLVTLNPADVAVLFEELPADRLPLLFRLLPKELAAETFVEMEPDEQELLIRGFSDNELKEVIDELYLDDAVDIVEEMPANVVKRILRSADPDTRKMINEILKYPEDSAGSIMTIEYVRLRRQFTVEQAIKHIRRTGIDKETIYTCYVTDDNRKLLGFVSVKTLLLSDEEASIEDVMETNVIYVHTSEDREVVANLFTNITSSRCPWWTTSSAWWASSRWMTRSTSCRRSTPRTSRRWPPSPPRESPTSRPASLRCGRPESPGCCCS